MFILGIESSCDDTSVALLDCSPKGCFVIKEVTASQIDLHKKYGGVVPELAGRAHAEKIVPLIEEVLRAPTLALPFLKREGKCEVWALPSMSGIGYRQMGYFLRGEMSLPEAVEILKRDTRHYAKRQMTWFKRNQRIKWIERDDKKAVGELVEKFIE